MGCSLRKYAINTFTTQLGPSRTRRRKKKKTCSICFRQNQTQQKIVLVMRLPLVRSFSPFVSRIFQVSYFRRCVWRTAQPFFRSNSTFEKCAVVLNYVVAEQARGFGIAARILNTESLKKRQISSKENNNYNARKVRKQITYIA